MQYGDYQTMGDDLHDHIQLSGNKKFILHLWEIFITLVAKIHIFTLVGISALHLWEFLLSRMREIFLHFWELLHLMENLLHLWVRHGAFFVMYCCTTFIILTVYTKPRCI